MVNSVIFCTILIVALECGLSALDVLMNKTRERAFLVILAILLPMEEYLSS